MKDLALSYVRFMTNGSGEDAWAVEELSERVQSSPTLAWSEILRINSLQVSGDGWRQHVYAAIGCGPLEGLLVLHEASMLPVVIAAAKQDAVLQRELSTIYESSVPPNTWVAIKSVTAQQHARA